MQSDYLAQLDDFINCISEKRYYDAHEAIEVIWFPKRFEKNNEVYLLKGFINSAVCFELIQKGKIMPSKKAWATYLKYRPLLYKISSSYLNKYHAIARHVENEKISLLRQ